MYLLQALSSGPLSEPFDTKRGFRQGDSLSCDFFNLMLERIIRAAELNREGTIFYKSVQLLAYADDIDIIGNNTRAVSSAFSRLDKEAKRMGLVVNEDKTKYLLSSNKQSAHSRLGSHVTVDSHNFEVVDNFIYLGTSINSNNNVSLEIQRRITLANRHDKQDKNKSHRTFRLAVAQRLSDDLNPFMKYI
ncbi:uncharacterized protein LOC105219282 isoform X2 [Zeugodacus cucurbitae]|uniref:uncharacterized protein LOC105219282 isoform X2 n=1 Tax=Zeugodacus cucurbitae TaxID=28588 RepID=UPI0023D966AF|nr:uncharacterized protein LOC105219282 isoform X2 [Zeugodacus cucurbitae]XP_054091507.1 uncharacterized protein LOC105219282 isoform X2 [Zeugodacus cucurbitae]